MKVRDLETILAPLATVEGLRTLDREFARLICRLADRPTELLAWLAALVSHATGQGHICIDLDDPAAALDASELEGALRPAAGLRWSDAVKDVNVIGRPGRYAPLILDRNRLYLHRYWDDERRLAGLLVTRGRQTVQAIERDRLRGLLDTYFPDVERERWQRVAASVAATRGLCVITGGPGTGKTTTVATIAAMLLQMQPHTRIVLTAPTGKAASRMQQAVANALEQRLKTHPEAANRMPRQATTVHRLLGAQPNGKGFRHGPENPVGADLLVLDEASMVDLPLMTRLFEALPRECRVILVGDRDQLASVEAGAVLGELCIPRALRTFSAKAAAELADEFATPLPHEMIVERPPGLADALVELTTVYRYQESLGAISRAVREAEPEAALSRREHSSDIPRRTPPPSAQQLCALLEPDILEGYRRYLTAEEPAAKLAALAEFRILCALRHGPYGVEALNAVAERILVHHGLIHLDAPFYVGRPVLVTRNDHTLQLYNGDIGFVEESASTEAGRRVLFAGPDGTLRAIAPHRLPPVETAFALTVHKSQGSEFSSVLLVLPDRDSPVLTRELVYTGLTRARHSACILADTNRFSTAVRRMSRRTSGLAERLWGAAESPACIRVRT